MDKKARARAAAADSARRTALRRAAMFSSPGVPRDCLASLPASARAFSGGGLAAALAFAAPGGVGWGAPLATELLDLTRANMRAVYEAAPGWGGWRDGKKRGELLDSDARYFVARAAGGGGGGGGSGGDSDGDGGGGMLLGFAGFRFLAEGERDVLYLYELQLAEAAQRKGLGKHLMALCEQAAREAGMQWCAFFLRPAAYLRGPLSILRARWLTLYAAPTTHPRPFFQCGSHRFEKQRVRVAVLLEDGLRRGRNVARGGRGDALQNP